MLTFRQDAGFDDGSLDGPERPSDGRDPGEPATAVVDRPAGGRRRWARRRRVRATADGRLVFYL